MVFKFNDYLGFSEKTELVFDPSWAQGRSVFGGLTAAVALEHIERLHSPQDQQLRSVQVNFCGPTVTDHPTTFDVIPLSSGRSVTQTMVQLVQDGVVKTQVTAIYAKRRTSDVQVASSTYSIPTDRNTFQPLPYIDKVTPAFIQHLKLVYDSGNFPFTGSDKTVVSGWMQFSDLDVHNDAELSNSALLALIDAWPPALLSLLKKPSPASSIGWNVEFIQPNIKISAREELYYRCEIREACDGYGHTEAYIYNSSGELIALSRQLVGVYDQR